MEGRPLMIAEALLLGVGALIVPVAWMIFYGLVGWVAIIVGFISHRLRARIGMKWRLTVVGAATLCGAGIPILAFARIILLSGAMPEEAIYYLGIAALLGSVAAATAAICEWIIVEMTA